MGGRVLGGVSELFVQIVEVTCGHEHELGEDVSGALWAVEPFKMPR
ncbi:hypothetical protein AB0H82_34640 [Streptomyces sp. NPDC050732]